MRFALVLLVIAACSKDEPKAPPKPSGSSECPALTDHLLSITSAGAANRDAEIKFCETQGYSADDRKCLMAAKNSDDILACGVAAAKRKAGSGSSSGSGSGS